MLLTILGNCVAVPVCENTERDRRRSSIDGAIYQARITKPAADAYWRCRGRFRSLRCKEIAYPQRHVSGADRHKFVRCSNDLGALNGLTGRPAQQTTRLRNRRERSISPRSIFLITVISMIAFGSGPRRTRSFLLPLYCRGIYFGIYVAARSAGSRGSREGRRSKIAEYARRTKILYRNRPGRPRCRGGGSGAGRPRLPAGPGEAFG